MTSTHTLWQKAERLLQQGEAVVAVVVESVKGSAPREAGAMMLVTAKGTFGSIGGGTLEWQASARAQQHLHGGPAHHTMRFALGPDLGQCCGGHVTLGLQRLTEVVVEKQLAEGVKPPRHLYLFGAGHVGKALVLTLAQTAFDLHWVDARPGAFPPVVPQNVTCHDTDDAVALFATAPHGSMVLVMTHSHALDLAIVDAALRSPHIAKTGLIGSATKRARFESRLRSAGIDQTKISSLICPIGLGGIRSKSPVSIAISTAAQMLSLDEALSAVEETSGNQPMRAAL